MRLSKVLALVTGSPADAAAIGHAASLLRETRGRLVILYVIKMPRSMPLDAEIPAEVDRAEQALQQAELAAEMQRSVDADMVQAREIGPALVHEAAVRDVDAVVMATEYPTDNGRFSLGAEIPYVLEHAACSVILIRSELTTARPHVPQENGGTGESAAES